MNTKLTLMTILLAACGSVEAPATPAVVHTFELKGLLQGHEKEVSTAVSILSKQYAHDVKAALATVDVTITGTNQDNIVCGAVTGNVAGCSHLNDSTRADIELFMFPQQRINETSLMHELGHTARKLIEGDSDASHADKEFWSMIGAAELEFEKT